MTTEAKLLREALQKIFEQHGQWNNGIWAANIARAALSHPTAAEPALETDEQLEALFVACGGCWTGDFWRVEDADLHPMLRTLRQAPTAAGQPQAPEQGVACFEREQRYIVFKLTDLRRFLSIDEIRQLYALDIKVDAYREQAGKGRLTALVVEHDWPEYEPTWKAIEQRVAGTTPPAPKLEPITDEPTYLCVAWGESDLTCASIVKGLDGVKQFLVSQWLGSADHECDNGTNTLAAAMADMQDRWRIEGAGWRWSAEFEIGGVSVQLVEAVDATAHHGISTKGAV